VYGGWSEGALAVRTGATFGWGSRNVTRSVRFPDFAEVLSGKQDEHASQAFGEVAYAVDSYQHLSLEPFAGIAWVDAASEAFAETGGAAALSGRGGDTSVAYSSLGLRLAPDAIGWDVVEITPRSSLAWQHAFGTLRPGDVLTFQDTQQSFLAFGTPIDADAANVDLDLEANIGDGGKLAIGYEGVLSDRVRLNTVHAELDWTF
jgi:outer membrane autotransporter protein